MRILDVPVVFNADSFPDLFSGSKRPDHMKRCSSELKTFLYGIRPEFCAMKPDQLFSSIDSEHLGSNLHHNTLISATVLVRWFDQQNRTCGARKVPGVNLESN